MIHNLANHTHFFHQTEEELSVLTKGLFFVPNPTKTLKQEIKKSWSKFKTCICWNNTFFATEFRKRNPVLRKQTGYPLSLTTTPQSTSSQKLGSISTPHWKTYSDLTLQEKTALNDLKNKRSIIIKLCDKDGGIWIMRTRDYPQQKTYLQGHNTYKLLTHNRKNTIAHGAGTFIHYKYTVCIPNT